MELQSRRTLPLPSAIIHFSKYKGSFVSSNAYRSRPLLVPRRLFKVWRAAAAASDTPTGDKWWEEYTDQEGGFGPAAQATLEMLDWNSGLCSQVARFCQTSLGRNAIKSLLPATTPSECDRLLAETKSAHALLYELAVDVDFGGISTDAALSALRRASRGGMLSGQSLLAISGLLNCASRLKKAIAIASRESLGYAALELIVKRFQDIALLPHIIQEVSAGIEEGGTVRETASEEVKRSRHTVRTVESRIKNILKGKSGEITERGGRLCVAIPISPEGPPKTSVLIGTSQGTWYLEPPAAVPLNNELAALRAEAAAAEEAVLWRLTGVVSDSSEQLHVALEAIVWLDCCLAKAKYGQWIDGSLPEIVPVPRFISGKKKGKKAEECYVDLKRLKNPLLLGSYLLSKEVSDMEKIRGKTRLPGWRGGKSGSSSPSSAHSYYMSSPSISSEEEEERKEHALGNVPPVPPVPIDISVSVETRVVVLTGPNTGGKTATLRTLGLAALAARAGLPIPALAPARIPFFDAVLADIGDEQSLSASLSTFSGHLKRIESLRKESTGKSLVLLDELGTGTDPLEGSALGIALVRALSEGGPGGAALTVATTHHSALAELKFNQEGGSLKFENASVEFDDIALAPTYRLQWGVPGRSNALNIAARLGLDSEIVHAAREKLGSGAAEVNDAIVELENVRRRAEKDEEAAEVANRAAQEGERAIRKLR